MHPRPSFWLLVLANSLLAIAIMIFAKGFFPYKPFLPGQAYFLEPQPVAPFDKVIFMVVDALRRLPGVLSLHLTASELTEAVTSCTPILQVLNSRKGILLSKSHVFYEA